MSGRRQYSAAPLARVRSRRRFAPVIAVLLLSGAQCPQNDPPPPVSVTENDQERIARLEREARALAKTDGCTSADQCRAAPVGERACGGPRDYMVYCTRTTDSAGLYRKLAELRQAEMDYNKKTGAMSTCEFRTPPELAIAGGSCKAR
ncbi:MAG: hypothetical protein WD825_14675 [Gemmatimonadaceae bacterium]